MLEINLQDTVVLSFFKHERIFANIMTVLGRFKTLSLAYMDVFNYYSSINKLYKRIIKTKQDHANGPEQ
jgi:hypothetical protein